MAIPTLAMFFFNFSVPRTLPGYGFAPVKLRPGAERRHHPVRVAERRDQTSVDSTNWSGYAVTGSKGSVTNVVGSWTVPTATCSGEGVGDSGYAAFWVGIDGWNSNTVEQIGTDSDCVTAGGTSGTPTYYAWFEFYPADGYYIGNPNNNFAGFTVQPGDLISAEVAAAGSSATNGPKGGPKASNGRFTVTITDSRNGHEIWSFSTTSNVPNAQQTSAEWIAEAPCCQSGGEVLPLADFSSVSFSNAFATVGSGGTQVLGDYGSSLQESTMVSEGDKGGSPAGTLMAQPSGVINNGTGFSITWFNPGP